MSDGGNTWQPPDPGAVPPPPGSAPAPADGGGLAPSAGPPTAPVEVTPGAPEPTGRRSTGKVVAGVVGALAIVAAGVFAITRFTGDASAGGAASPEDAANAFLDALHDEDVLGIIDVLLPGERETFRQPLQDLASELERLEVLSDDDLSGVGGVDLVVTERRIEAEPTNVDDIVNLTVTASVGGSIDGEELPIGDWIREHLGADELAELDEEAPAEEGSFPVTAVRKGGRWYLSLFYTVAEQARAGLDVDIPEQGIALNGGDSPEEAMDHLLAAVADLDLAGLLGALNPNEFEALQRYAPLFLDEAQDGLDEVPVDIDISGTAYTVEGSGSARSLTLTAVDIELTSDGETIAARLVDGCWVLAFEGDEIDVCGSDFEELTGELEAELGDVEGFDEARERLEAIFADYDAPGLAVRQVDGKWYVSPMATMSEQVLAVIRALSRDEIEDLVDLFSTFVVAAADELEGSGIEVPALEEFELPGDEDLGWGESGDDDELSGADDERSGADDPEADPEIELDEFGQVCYFEERLEDAAACFEELVATGEVRPDLVPWFVRHPECDAGELFWLDEYFLLDDEDFVAAVDALAPCVQDLVTIGEVQEIEVPAELLEPGCIDGRNPYLLEEGDAAFDDFLACISD